MTATSTPRTVLRTARQTLRELVPDDAAAMFDLDADPEVLRYVPDCGLPTVADVRRDLEEYQEVYRKDGFARWAASEAASGEFLGWCGLRRQDDGEVDLGYRYRRATWGRGLVTEAARACLAYAFVQLALPRVVAVAHESNAASIRVLEKIGLHFESATTYDALPAVRYSLTHAAWRAAHESAPNIYSRSPYPGTNRAACPERHVFIAVAVKPCSVDHRERAVALLAKGESSAAVAVLLNVGDGWARTMRIRLAERGNLAPGTPPGKARWLSPEDEERLALLAIELPDATLRELAELAAKRMKLRMSISTISRRLIEMGLTRKQKSVDAAERDLPHVQEQREAFRELELIAQAGSASCAFSPPSHTRRWQW